MTVVWRGDRLVWSVDEWAPMASDAKFSMFLMRCQHVALRLLVEESRQPDPPVARTEPISEQDLTACIVEAYGRITKPQKSAMQKRIEAMTQKQEELTLRILNNHNQRKTA